MLGHGLSVLYLTQKDKPHSWESAFELLLATEWHEGETIVILGRIGLGADVGIKARDPQARLFQDFPFYRIVDIFIAADRQRIV